MFYFTATLFYQIAKQQANFQLDFGLFEVFCGHGVQSEALTYSKVPLRYTLDSKTTQFIKELDSVMSLLSVDSIREQLKTHSFGQNVVYVKQTDSTNTNLKELARQGAPHGLLYLADEQLAGRGRLGRSWYAPANSSLLMSLLFRPGQWLKPQQAQRLTMLAALSLAEAIETHTNLSIGLKWPNDLVWRDGKKLAGILTELDIEGDQLNWVVVGLGLNVNIDFSLDSLPSEIGNPTSLAMILEHDTSQLRLPILQSFLMKVEQRYEALRQGQSPHQAWARRLVGVGRWVTVTGLDGSQQSGLINGVDKNGALLLKQADGSCLTVWAGEVTLRSCETANGRDCE